MRDPTAPEPRPRRDVAAGEEPVRAPEEDSQTAPQPPDAESQPTRQVREAQVNQEQPAEGSPGLLRLPVPLVAGGLIALLLVLLGVGLYANAALRGPTTVLVPTPVAQTPVGAVAAAATPSPLPATAATTPMPPAATAATGTPRPLAAAVAVTSTAPPATAVATAAPTSTDVPAAVVVTATPNPTSPSPLPTVEPTLAAEVGAAYENFWRVTSQALLQLDTTQLTDVMAEDYLGNVTNRIDELRAEGRAIKTQVTLDYTVVQGDAISATVIDDFEDDSVYVVAGTQEPLSEPTGDRVVTLYKLRNFDGSWKVVDSVRSQ